MSDETAASRREALRRGALAVGALAAAGMARPALALGQSPADEDLRDFLVEAIAREQVTVLAYATVADATDVADTRRIFEDFRDQEQAHANALLSAIDEVGFDPPAAPDSPDDTAVLQDVEGLSDEAASQLTDRLKEISDATNEAAQLRLLNELENDQITFYVGKGPGLDTADLSTTAVEIAGCQGQHLIVLGDLEGKGAGEVAAAVSATASEAAPTEAQ